MAQKQEARELESSDASDSALAYRLHLTEVIMWHCTRGGAIENAEAYRQVKAVTGRTIGTVRNWLVYRIFVPDAISLARIVNHWQIPPESIFPPNLDALLTKDATPTTIDKEAEARIGSAEELIVSPYGRSDPSALDRALLKYTDNPRSLVLVRYSASDMVDEIRPGELIAIDPSVEQILESGLYYLRFSTGTRSARPCVRLVETLLAEDAVRLRSGSSTTISTTETVQLQEGQLPPHISVLGRVVGVLRRT